MRKLKTTGTDSQAMSVFFRFQFCMWFGFCTVFDAIAIFNCSSRAGGYRKYLGNGRLYIKVYFKHRLNEFSGLTWIGLLSLSS